MRTIKCRRSPFNFSYLDLASNHTLLFVGIAGSLSRPHRHRDGDWSGGDSHQDRAWVWWRGARSEHPVWAASEVHTRTRCSHALPWCGCGRPPRRCHKRRGREERSLRKTLIRISVGTIDATEVENGTNPAIQLWKIDFYRVTLARTISKPKSYEN